MDASLTTIIVAIITAIGSPLVVSYYNRRKNAAEAKKTDAEASSITSGIEAAAAQHAMALMKATLDNTVKPLNNRIDQLEAELQQHKQQLEGQAETIEHLNAQFVRLQLAFLINVSYIKSLGKKPPIELSTIDNLSTDDLRDIAASMHHIEERRGQAEK